MVTVGKTPTKVYAITWKDLGSFQRETLFVHFSKEHADKHVYQMKGTGDYFPRSLDVEEFDLLP